MWRKKIPKYTSGIEEAERNRRGKIFERGKKSRARYFEGGGSEIDGWALIFAFTYLYQNYENDACELMDFEMMTNLSEGWFRDFVLSVKLSKISKMDVMCTLSLYFFSVFLVFEHRIKWIKEYQLIKFNNNV